MKITNMILYPLALAFLLALNFLLMHFIFPQNNEFDAQRLVQLIFMSYVAVILLCPRYGKAVFTVVQKLPKISQLGILLFFALGVFSSMQAASPKYAFLEVSVYFLWFVGCCALARVVLEESEDPKLFTVILIGTVNYLLMFIGLFIFFFFLMPLSQNIFVKQIFFPGFVNIRFFVQYQIWLLPLLLLPLVAKKNFRWWRPLLFLVIFIWWAFTFYNASRGEFIALAVAAVATWLIFREQAYRWFRVNIVGIVGGFVLYQIIFKTLLHLPQEFAFSRTADDTYDRLANLRHAFHLIRSHPWLGVGPMHFAYYPPPNFFTHPHNSILALASEWGIPATLIILFLFFWGFLRWVKCFSFKTFRDEILSDKTKMLLISLTASGVAGFFYSLVDGVFTMPMGQFTSMVFVGWMIGVYQRYAVKTGAIEMRLFLRILMPVFLLLGLVVLWGVVAPMLPSLSANEFLWLQEHPETGSLFHPNFWIQGLIYT